MTGASGAGSSPPWPPVNSSVTARSIGPSNGSQRSGREIVTATKMACGGCRRTSPAPSQHECCATGSCFRSSTVGTTPAETIATEPEDTTETGPEPIEVVPLTPRSELPDDVGIQISIELEDHDPLVLDIDDPSRTVVAEITAQPGAQFPWHTHPGPVLVNVTESELTYVLASDCVERAYPAGTAFVDPGRDSVHTAFNATDEVATLIAVFFEITDDGPLTITEGVEAPEDCHIEVGGRGHSRPTERYQPMTPERVVEARRMLDSGTSMAGVGQGARRVPQHPVPGARRGPISLWRPRRRVLGVGTGSSLPRPMPTSAGVSLPIRRSAPALTRQGFSSWRRCSSRSSGRASWSFGRFDQSLEAMMSTRAATVTVVPPRLVRRARVARSS